MTISEAIRELWERSKLKQEAYAAMLGRGRTHANAVLNGRAEGSTDMLEKALHHARLEWSQVLVLPPRADQVTENQRLLRVIQNALAAGGEDRKLVKEMVQILEWREEARKSRKEGASQR